MHNLFLGTAKHMMKIWIERDIISKDDMKVLQSRVDSIKVPGGTGRIPKKIASCFGGFTAEQWKNWVILYSMYALRGILPQEHYLCWQAFVLSCFFLCRREISPIELKKADLLLLKFCKGVENLYGTSSITPNMHLHGHLAQCIEDYGSVYNFWLFAFERYNGVLDDYPTNKRNISVQLMQRFVYEAESYHLPLPSKYVENFQQFLPLNERFVSDVHQHENSIHSPLDLQHVALPATSKFSTLDPVDHDKIKGVYAYLYGEVAANNGLLWTIKVYKSLTFYRQHFGSLKLPSSTNSSYLMATWADSDGSIANEDAVPRPGRVLYYFTHQYKLNDTCKEHLFAAVCWYRDHFCHSLYGKPLEIWSTDYIPEGTATFLPMHKLKCRCSIAFGTIPLPEGGEERVLFVSPLPSLKYS